MSKPLLEIRNLTGRSAARRRSSRTRSRRGLLHGRAEGEIVCVVGEVRLRASRSSSHAVMGLLPKGSDGPTAGEISASRAKTCSRPPPRVSGTAAAELASMAMI